MASLIFGVRLDELETVDQLRSVTTGFLDGDRTCRIFTPAILLKSSPVNC